MHRRFLSLICLLCAAVVALPTSAQVPTPSDFRETVKKAKAKVFPAVVFIKCVQETHESGKKQSSEVAGSGVLISEKGELLTNHHVIDHAVEVRCLLHDGRYFDAEVVGHDKDLDIALVQLKLTEDVGPIPFAKLGESAGLNEGDFVMAMGAPWGMTRSVSIGIVSCTSRFLSGDSPYSLWLQTDAAISPGNSGGPLVNTDGEVVGINTLAYFYGGDCGFAVPSTTIRQILPRLQEKGDISWAWTGLDLQPIRDFNRNMYFDGTNGVIVASIDRLSPAEEAGISERDRILSIDDTAVTAMTDEDLPDIRRFIALLPVDEPVKVKLVRGKKEMTVDLTPCHKGKVEGAELDCPRWDMTIKAINRFEAKDLFFYKKTGVYIYGIKYPGNASNSRLRERDIILEVDGKKVETLEDVKRIHKETVDNVDEKPRIKFKVMRNGLQRQAILDISRDYERE